MKKGLLLINLGTPNHPDVSSVRRYLRVFLSDRRVITLPAPLRFLLLYGIILPFRAQRTTHAYQRIWTPQGSPLLINSLNFKKKLQDKLQDEYLITLGMRYGDPSIESALHALESCSEITILPLFPQYSSAATGSSIESVLHLLALKTPHPSLRLTRDFHNHTDFIAAQAAIIKPYLSQHDHLLFSYHGLPEHHLTQIGCHSPCRMPCPSTKKNNPSCYRAQCFQTTEHIAHQLQLNSEQYSTCFQSRLGKIPWIKPYTDHTLIDLAQRGVKRLAVVCPSFVADCLETLEEIGIRAKEQWMALGGEQFTLIPCLNDSEAWVHAVDQIIR